MGEGKGRRNFRLAVGTSNCTEVYECFWKVPQEPRIRPSLLKGQEEASVLSVEPTMLLDMHAHLGGVAFGHGGSMLSIAGGQYVSVISLSTGGAIFSLRRAGRVRCCAVNGQMLVAGGFDKVVGLYKLGAGAEKHTFDMSLPAETYNELVDNAEDEEDQSLGDAQNPSGVTESLRKGSSLFLRPKYERDSLRDDDLDTTVLAKEWVWDATKRGESQERLSERVEDGQAARRSTRKSERKSHRPSFLAVSDVNMLSDHVTVRSVHVSDDSSRLAVGVDKGMSGVVRLFEAGPNRLLQEWVHEKPVWVVRLTSNGALLAAAGYDCALTLYDAHNYSVLQRVRFESHGGPPAFIWSCNFSADDRLLCVACWNGDATVYKVQPPQYLAEGAACLTTAVTVNREDRAYGAALDGSGRHLAVCGRDKMVAMYELQLWDDAPEVRRGEAKPCAD